MPARGHSEPHRRRRQPSHVWQGVARFGIAALDKIKFITDENQPVAHVTSVKEEVVATPDATAAEAAAPAEPEVIKKGKQETEEEGAEAPAAKPEKAEKKEKK